LITTNTRTKAPKKKKGMEEGDERKRGRGGDVGKRTENLKGIEHEN